MSGVTGGFGARVGVRPGDRLLSMNGVEVGDLLDVMTLLADIDELQVEFDRDGDLLALSAPYDGTLGIEFECPAFDGLRSCANNCPFCYVDQLPKGLRQSLYFKDDDYRLSVLTGSFVTLTNLTESDWTRLREQRPGPMRVSVHCTDITLRRALLGNARAPDVLEQISELGRLGITIDCQVVLLRGVNDGTVLERTVRELAALQPAVRSIGVVPVGRTRFSPPASEHWVFDVAQSEALVSQVSEWQRQYRRLFQSGLVYLADEFYLAAGVDVPSARSYDGYPQYENGIGMVRWLLDDASRALRAKKLPVLPERFALVCGTAIAPLLEKLLRQAKLLTGSRGVVCAVKNEFFGHTVTTSGLLTGADVLRAIGDRDLGSFVVLPRTMLDAAGTLALDGMDVQQLRRAVAVPVYFASSLSGLLGLVSSSQGDQRN